MKIWVGVVFLSGVVNGLLLLCASLLCGGCVRWRRIVLGILASMIYTGLCLHFTSWRMGTGIWRLLSLCLVGVVGYGWKASGLQMGLVYVFLTLTLEGTALGLSQGGSSGWLATGGILCLVCCFALRGTMSGATYLPVELRYNGKHLCLTALHDTGNTLRDPVTGQRVLVIGADAAGELTGLTPSQLRCPVESVGSLPGLRLIPYRSIGKNSGFLLALRLKDVRIGRWQGSSLVAFAPEGLGKEDVYQALTGGIV